MPSDDPFLARVAIGPQRRGTNGRSRGTASITWIASFEARPARGQQSVCSLKLSGHSGSMIMGWTTTPARVRLHLNGHRPGQQVDPWFMPLLAM